MLCSVLCLRFFAAVASRATARSGFDGYNFATAIGGSGEETARKRRGNGEEAEGFREGRAEGFRAAVSRFAALSTSLPNTLALSLVAKLPL